MILFSSNAEYRKAMDAIVIVISDIPKTVLANTWFLIIHEKPPIICVSMIIAAMATPKLQSLVKGYILIENKR